MGSSLMSSPSGSRKSSSRWGRYLLRHGDRLRKGIEEVADLKANLLPCLKAYDPHYLRMAVEAKNMLLCAECFLKAALAREESRGSHLREDFPFSENQHG